MTRPWSEVEREFPGVTAAATPGRLESLIDRLGMLGTEILTELRHIRTQSGERISSATVKTSTRGVDFEVHSYDDGRLINAVDDAIEQYARGLREITALQANGWQQTAEALERVREGAGE